MNCYQEVNYLQQSVNNIVRSTHQVEMSGRQGASVEHYVHAQRGKTENEG